MPSLDFGCRICGLIRVLTTPGKRGFRKLERLLYNSRMEKLFIDAEIVLTFAERQKRPDLLIGPINTVMKDLFDTAPLVLPIPDSPTADQAVAVRYASGNYRLGITRTSAGFVFQGDGPQTFDDVREEFIKHYKQFTFAVLDAIPLARIGVVAQFVIAEDSSSKRISDLIADSIKGISPGEVQDAGLQYSAKDTLPGGKIVNNGIKLASGGAILNKTGEIQKKDVPGVIVTRDVNISDKPEVRVTKDDAIELIDYTLAKLKLDEIETAVWPKATR